MSIVGSEHPRSGLKLRPAPPTQYPIREREGMTPQRATELVVSIGREYGCRFVLEILREQFRASGVFAKVVERILG